MTATTLRDDPAVRPLEVDLVGYGAEIDAHAPSVAREATIRRSQAADWGTSPLPSDARASARRRRRASTLLGRVATLSTEMKRELLAQLSNDDLVALADRIGVPVHDESAEGELIDSIVNSRTLTLNMLLPVLSRARREEVCRALGIGDRRPEGCIVSK